jgi:arylsulfatase A-like enzyme
VTSRRTIGARSVLALSLLAAASSAGGCRRSSSKQLAVDAGADARPPPLPPTAPDVVAVDLMEESPRCRVEHRGALVDVGTPAATWSTPGHADEELPAFERDGATWGRVLDKVTSFTVPVDVGGSVIISARGRGRAAKKAIASVDGKVVGQLHFSTTEDKVVTAGSSTIVLSPGLHQLQLRWLGSTKKEEPLAELDWVRLGVGDDDPSSYAAPTRKDVVAQVALQGAPRKAFTLRAPSVVRCVAWIPAGAQLMADIGVVGEGEGQVELRERTLSSEEPRVLARETATSKGWVGVHAPLSVGGETGRLAMVEVAVTRAPKQGRVAVAEPRVVRTTPPPKVDTAKLPHPRAVVVLVLAGLTTAQLELPGLAKLARESAVFRGHHAPSPLAGASVASLITGLPVPVHAVEDAGARLSPRTPRVTARLGTFGVETAMFSEAPTTGPAFGFNTGWLHYAARSPLDGAPAAYEELEKFLAAHPTAKTFAIAHARGAHPPWDVPSDVVKTLAPEGYTGPVDPKHVVALLAKARRGLYHPSDADRTRMVALQDVAIAAEDRRLSTFVEGLRASGALEQTTLIVTSDVPLYLPRATKPAEPSTAPKTAPKIAPSAQPSASASAPRPAGPPPLPPGTSIEDGEEPLSVPLLIRFPDHHAGGRLITAQTDPTDVAATIVAAFGGPIDDLAGRDLAALAVDDEPSRDLPRLSDDGRVYQLAWGDVRLVGIWGRTPTLRASTSDDELRARRPFEYLAAWGLAVEARRHWLSARKRGPGREPATIDAATQAGMDAWEKAK